MVDVEIDDIKVVYSIIYSTPIKENRFGSLIGRFKLIKQLREDLYTDDFIGQNIYTGEVCIILSKEICGHGGGIAYEVFPLKNLAIKTSK